MADIGRSDTPDLFSNFSYSIIENYVIPATSSCPMMEWEMNLNHSGCAKNGKLMNCMR
jgi:hypothetical protein